MSGYGGALVVGIVIEQPVFPCGVFGCGRPAVGIPQFVQGVVRPQTGQIRQNQTSEKEIDPDRDIKQRVGREKQPDAHSDAEQADGAQPAQIPLYDAMNFGQFGGIRRQCDAQQSAVLLHAFQAQIIDADADDKTGEHNDGKCHKNASIQ